MLVALADLMATLWQPVVHTLLVPSSLPAMVTAAVLAMLLIAVTTAAAPRHLSSPPTIRGAAAFRERAARVVLSWQSNPDADGHVRPRAPATAPAVA
jgi:hypothetical protein